MLLMDLPTQEGITYRRLSDSPEALAYNSLTSIASSIITYEHRQRIRIVLLHSQCH